MGEPDVQRCYHDIGRPPAAQGGGGHPRRDRALGAVIATTTQPPAPLVRALAERQKRLDALDARLRASTAAPAAIELEVRRMEAEVKQRLGEIRAALGRNSLEARKVLEILLDGPLRVSPVGLPEGRRFQIEGAAALGRLLAIDAENPNYLRRDPGRLRNQIQSFWSLLRDAEPSVDQSVPGCV